MQTFSILQNFTHTLQEYQNKLAKVQAVRSQLQAHLDSLPDLANLTSAPLEPLPDAGALFDAGGDNGRFLFKIVLEKKFFYFVLSSEWKTSLSLLSRL